MIASLRRGSDQRPFFLGAAFLAPLLLMGLRPAPYFLVRYTVYLHPLLAILFAATVVWSARAVSVSLLSRASASPSLTAWRTPPGIPLEGATSPMVHGLTALLALGALLLPFGLASPGDARGVRGRDYGWNGDRIRDGSLTSHFYYDVKSPALFVRERRAAGDLVIARDPVNLYPYLGPSDYMIRGPGYGGVAWDAEGRAVDKVVGTPILSSGQALAEVLGEEWSRRIWIVSAESVPGGPNVNLPDDLLAVLDGLEPSRVYTARDGLGYVLRIDPQRDAPG
jgi:hypothetical protein